MTRIASRPLEGGMMKTREASTGKGRKRGRNPSRAAPGRSVAANQIRRLIDAIAGVQPHGGHGGRSPHHPEQSFAPAASSKPHRPLSAGGPRPAAGRGRNTPFFRKNRQRGKRGGGAA